MTRNVQKLANVTLFFFCLHPATGKSQSQKSQFWRVPALPSFETTSEQLDNKGSVVVPKPFRAKKFHRLLAPADSWSDSAHQLGVGGDELESTRSIFQSLADKGVTVLGSESGSWGGGRISMRGHSGKEPDVSLDGVSLGSGFSGGRSELLVPLAALREIRISPFFSDPGSPHRTISGRYDLVTKSGHQEFGKETHIQIEEPSALVSAHRHEFDCDNAHGWLLGCSQLSWQWASRRGHQRVMDDNNTPGFSSDDFESALKHNDLDRASVLLRTQRKSSSGLELDTTSILGFENRGVNGLPLLQVSPDNRSHKTLALLSHSATSFSPENGRFWTYRFSGRADETRFLTSMQNQAQQSRSEFREEKVVSAGIGFSVPIFPHSLDTRIFFGGHLEINRFTGVVDVVEPESNQNVPKRAHSSLGGTLSEAELGGGIEFLKAGQYLVRTEFYLQSAALAHRQSCGVFAPQFLCTETLGDQFKTSPSSALEVQYRPVQNAILYGLVGQSIRLPAPIELAGRPDGIAANLLLKPESAIFVESGIQTSFAHVGLFIANDFDLIFIKQMSPYLVRYENAAPVQRLGWFGNADFRLDRLDFSGYFEQTSVKPKKITMTRRVVPFIPSWRAQTSLKWHFGHKSTVGDLGRFSAGLMMNQSGPYALDEQGLNKLTPPSTVSVALGANFLRSGRDIVVDLKAENLFDSKSSRLSLGGHEEQKVAWSYLPALPIAGRSYSLSLRLHTP